MKGVCLPLPGSSCPAPVHTSVGGEQTRGLAKWVHRVRASYSLLSPELTLRLLRRLSSDLPRGVGGSHSATIPQINEGIIPDLKNKTKLLQQEQFLPSMFSGFTSTDV